MEVEEGHLNLENIKQIFHHDDLVWNYLKTRVYMMMISIDFQIVSTRSQIIGDSEMWANHKELIHTQISIGQMLLLKKKMSQERGIFHQEI